MTRPADEQVGPVAAAPDCGLPAPTEAARAIFGAQLPGAVRYAQLLAEVGTAHGHLGPREVPRLWDRHLCNSAVVTDLLPTGAAVLDIGSGAGLPGVAMAIRRPDLHLTLIEPMLRRSRFLDEVVETLGLTERVTVLRGRAEDETVVASVAGASWATARAVAPLDRLLSWCLPLLAPGGRLLALKGSTAHDELAGYHPKRGSVPIETAEVVELGAEYELVSTHVIVVERGVDSVRRRRRTQ